MDENKCPAREEGVNLSLENKTVTFLKKNFLKILKDYLMCSCFIPFPLFRPLRLFPIRIPHSTVS